MENIDWLVNWKHCLSTRLSECDCNQCSNLPVNLFSEFLTQGPEILDFLNLGLQTLTVGILYHVTIKLKKEFYKVILLQNSGDSWLLLTGQVCFKWSFQVITPVVQSLGSRSTSDEGSPWGVAQIMGMFLCLTGTDKVAQNQGKWDHTNSFILNVDVAGPNGWNEIQRPCGSEIVPSNIGQLKHRLAITGFGTCPWYREFGILDIACKGGVLGENSHRVQNIE